MLLVITHDTYKLPKKVKHMITIFEFFPKRKIISTKLDSSDQNMNSLKVC